MQRASAQEDKHPRGVFKTRYKVRGGVYAIIAIDSTGECRKAIRLEPGIDLDRAALWLEMWLDRVDPMPKLVRVEPEFDQRLPDPCQADHAIVHALRVASENAKHLKRLPN
jgi:hypothetical protein